MLLVVAGGALQFLRTAEEFMVQPENITLTGFHYTDEARAREAIGLTEDQHPNLFRVETASIEQVLLEMPAVLEADVQASLPNRLSIEIAERSPVFVLDRAGEASLVDADGVVFVRAPSEAETASLPLIEDLRSGATVPALGSEMEPEDFDAARLLGALTPGLVGSAAERLTVRVEDELGYVVTPSDESWRAVFGFYTANLRPTSLVDLQVQCLRALLADGEDKVDTIYLSPSEDRCGTYLPATAANSGHRGQS